MDNIKQIYYNVKNKFKELETYTPVPPDSRHLLKHGVLVKYCNINDIHNENVEFKDGIVQKKDVYFLYLKKRNGWKIKLNNNYIFYKINENDPFAVLFDQIADEL